MTPPRDLLQPSREAPGAIRTPRRTPRTRRRAPRRWSPPPARSSPAHPRQPVRSPARQPAPARQPSPPRQPVPPRQPASQPAIQPATSTPARVRTRIVRPPENHPMRIPAWAIETEDVWFRCPLCLEREMHSAFVCMQCFQRPACCFCVDNLEASPATRGRCPICRYQGPQ